MTRQARGISRNTASTAYWPTPLSCDVVILSRFGRLQLSQAPRRRRSFNPSPLRAGRNFSVENNDQGIVVGTRANTGSGIRIRPAPFSWILSRTFDLRGRKTASSDPDMGSWTYSYDVLSELTSQVDAKSQTTSLHYDLMGRPTQRVESGLTSNWVYDTATDGVGMPTSACTAASCTAPSNSTVFE